MSAKKADRLSWFKFDAGHFLSDVTGLPASFVGIYARLLALYWTEGGALPDDDSRLKRRIGVSTAEEEDALREVMAEFFPERRHAGLDLQLQAVRETSSARAAAGRKGGSRASTSAASSTASQEF